LALLNQCGRAWAFRYVDRLPSVPTPALLFGSAIHRAIECALSAWALGDDAAEPAPLWKPIWEEATATTGVTWGKDDPGALFERGRAMLRHPATLAALREATPGLDGEGRPLIEVPVRLWALGVPVPLIGYVDCITKSGVVVDIKTAGKSWDEADAHDPTGEKGIQATFYLSALLQMGYEVPGRRFRFLVLPKTKRGGVQVIETSRSAGELMRVTLVVGQAWEAIGRGDFQPNVFGEMCRPARCGYWSVCPDGGGKR
jgi:hypothetical protein